MALPTAGRTWKLVKFLVRESAYSIPAAYSYLEGQLTNNEPATPLVWMRWIVTWTRVAPAGLTEDKGQFKLDLLNITGGAVDSTWTGADFTACQAAIGTFTSGRIGQFSSNQSWAGSKVYAMRFNPDDPGPGQRSKANGYAFAPTGPPVFVDPFTQAMTGSAGLPFQVAASVTLKTALPRHWGRVYMPTPASTAIDTNGRLGATFRSGLADSFSTMVKALSDADFLPVVPMTDLHRSTFHGLMGVNQVVVDDVPDIQRRRRPKQTAVRTVGA